MADRLARCTNRDYCTLGDSGAVLRLAAGDRFFCPECAHALEAVPDRRAPQPVLWPAASVRLARCANRDYCTLGDRGTVLRLAADAAPFCPECAHALVPAPDRRASTPYRPVAAILTGGAAVAAALLLAVSIRHPAPRRVAHVAQAPAPPAPSLEMRSDPAATDLAMAVLGMLPSPYGPLRRHHVFHGPRIDMAAADAMASLATGIPVAPGMPWHEWRPASGAAMPWRQALIMAALMSADGPPPAPPPASLAPPAPGMDPIRGQTAGGQSSSAAPAGDAAVQVAARADAAVDLAEVEDTALDDADGGNQSAPPPLRVALVLLPLPSALAPSPVMETRIALLALPAPRTVAAPPSAPPLAPLLAPLRAPPATVRLLQRSRLQTPHAATQRRVARLTRPAKQVVPPPKLVSVAVTLRSLVKVQPLAPPPAETGVVALLPPPRETVAAPMPAKIPAAPQTPPAATATNAEAPHGKVVMLPATQKFSFGYGPLKNIRLPDQTARSIFLPARPSSEKPKPGSLKVDCAIETTGVPSDCRVLSAHNAGPVTEALLGWLGSGLVHYAPTMADGEAVRARRTITVDFPAEARR